MKTETRLFAFVPAVLAFILIFPLSCSRGHTIGTLDFPSTPAVSTQERFALVVDPYVSMRDRPGSEGITISHGRRGEIYPVSGNRLVPGENSNVVWIHLGTGWVAQSSVQLYSSMEKAKTAAAVFD